MFFELSKKNNKNFSYNYAISSNFFLNLDDGWSITNIEKYKIYFKGYCENYNELELCKKICQKSSEQFLGNFTAILESEDEITIINDNFRSYPIFFDKKENIVTNLFLEGEKVDYKHCFNFNKKNELFTFKKNKIDYNILEKQSLEQVINKIDVILENNIKYFIDNNKKPLKIFLTGGIDSLLIYSYVKKFTKNFEIIGYEYRKWTKFSRDNWGQIIKTSNEYTTSHSWGDSPTTVISGHYGDQFFMRELLTFLLYLRSHNKNFDIESKIFQKSYSYNWFMKEIEKTKTILKDKKYQIISLDKKKTIEYCIDISNHINFIWHIDNTMYYTPLKNLEIIKLILSLPIDYIIKNAFECTIQRSLLERNDKDLVKLLLFDEKNHGSYKKIIQYLKK
jgi:hypothetical protein